MLIMNVQLDKCSFTDYCCSGMSFFCIGNPPATINDMSELIDFVEDIAPKWIYIGIKFGQIQNVKVIKSYAKGSEDSCLDMLFNWFHAGVDVTWPKFLGVLRHDAIGLGRVANSIEKVNIRESDLLL